MIQNKNSHTHTPNQHQDAMIMQPGGGHKRQSRQSLVQCTSSHTHAQRWCHGELSIQREILPRRNTHCWPLFYPERIYFVHRIAFKMTHADSKKKKTKTNKGTSHGIIQNGTSGNHLPPVCCLEWGCPSNIQLPRQLWGPQDLPKQTSKTHLQKKNTAN